MSSKTYSQVTGLCLATAVACALAFDHVGGLRWLAGAVAILSGLMAAGVYFYNQWASDTSQGSKEAKEERTSVPQPLVLAAHGNLAFEWARRRAEVDAARHRWVLTTDYDELIERFYVAPHHGLVMVERHIGPQVDDIIKIVQRLSSSAEGSAYEFVLSRTGDFTIRSRGRAKPFETVFEKSEQEEEFAPPAKAN